MELIVHGNALSPWVRRLMVCLEEKGLDYDTVNVVPMGEADPEFLKISPLGKVPVLEVDGKHLPDSLAGCVFLESVVPEPALFPVDSWDRGWMVWLCDFLGTALFSKVEAPLFIHRFVNPNFRKIAPDQAKVDQALKEMPGIFDYIEGQLEDGRSYLMGDSATLADMTAGSIFVNFRHAGATVDATNWPRLAEYVYRVHARQSFQRVLARDREMVGALSPMFAA